MSFADADAIRLRCIDCGWEPDETFDDRSDAEPTRREHAHLPGTTPPHRVQFVKVGADGEGVD